MDPYLEDRLEEYLAGALVGQDLERFESKLEEDDEAAELVMRLSADSQLFDAIRVTPEETPVLMPGFAAQVMRNIEEEKETPFWAVFTQPFMLKRLAFGSLMWLAALGGVTLMSDQSTTRSTELADMILTEQPPVEHFYVRMGPNLNQNRESMLSVMMSPGDR